MICPIDQTTLVIAERQGIEIDYCPKCRGVWLDRGELDKMIERMEPPAPTAAQPVHREEPRHDYDDRRRYSDDDDHRRYDSNDGRHHKKHKREGFLGDLFDF